MCPTLPVDSLAFSPVYCTVPFPAVFCINVLVYFRFIVYNNFINNKTILRIYSLNLILVSFCGKPWQDFSLPQIYYGAINESNLDKTTNSVNIR